MKVLVEALVRSNYRGRQSVIGSDNMIIGSMRVFAEEVILILISRPRDCL